MTNDKYHNAPAVQWAALNLSTPVSVRPLFSSRAGRIFTYALLFSVPAFFIAFGLVFALLFGLKDRSITVGPIVIGLLMLVPAGVIALVATYVRRGFVKTLDANAVRGSMGQSFSWADLYYVDHVSKYTRIGGVSHRIKDNQIELVFAGGKAVIPPLIHHRAEIWELISRLPAQVRDDGVPRGQTSSAGQ